MFDGREGEQAKMSLYHDVVAGLCYRRCVHLHTVKRRNVLQRGGGIKTLGVNPFREETSGLLTLLTAYPSVERQIFGFNYSACCEQITSGCVHDPEDKKIVDHASTRARTLTGARAHTHTQHETSSCDNTY